MASLRILRLNKSLSHWFFTLFSLYAIYLSAAIGEFARSPQAVLLLVVLAVAFLVKTRGLRWLTNKTGLWLLGLSLIIELFHYMSTGVFTIGSLKFFALIITIYHLVNQFGRTVTDVLFGVIYRLTIITIPFFVLQIIDHSLVSNLLLPFDMSLPGQSSSDGIYVFFFNLCSWQPLRNSGFMWEAGAFGAMLVFLIVYRFVFTDNMNVERKTAWVFLYAFTTFSTTTFLALFLCLIFLVFQRYKRNVLKFSLYTGMAILIAIPIYNSSFMKDKIEMYLESNIDYNRIYSNRQYSQTQSSVSIGRFAGLLIELDRVKARPVFGFGWNDDYSSVGIGNEWSNPNGLAVLLGKFGFLGVGLVCFGLFNFMLVGPGVSKLERMLVGLILVLPLFSNPFQYNVILWIMIMMGWVNIVRKRSVLIPTR